MFLEQRYVSTHALAIIWRGSGLACSLLEDVLLTVKNIIVAINHFAKKITYCDDNLIFGDNIVLSCSCITPREYIIIMLRNCCFTIIIIALVAACIK